MSDVLVTTLSAPADHDVIEEKGVVMGNSYATVLPAESLSTARNIEAAQKSAVDYLKTLAERLGANAVVGLRIERLNMGAFIDVLAYGTAARVARMRG